MGDGLSFHQDNDAIAPGWQGPQRFDAREDDEAASEISWAQVVRFGEDCWVGLLIIIQTGALVTLPQKLAGGGALPWTGYVWALGALMTLIFAATSPWRTLRAAVAGWPVLLLLGWTWASLTWSIAPYETLRGAVYLTASMVFAFALAGRFTWRRIVGVTTVSLSILLGVSIVLALVMPSIGRMQEIHPGAWSGVWAEKQLFGVYASHLILAALALVAFKDGRTFWWLAVPVGLIAIIGATGRSAMIMSLGAVGVAMVVWMMQRGRLTAIFATWAGIIGAAVLAVAVFAGLELVLKALGRGSDFTGRTEVWDAVRIIADQRPWTGWGYQAIWRGEDEMTSPMQWVMQWTDFKPANAHSSWLDTYLMLGIPGVTLLALVMGWAWLQVLGRLWTGARSLVFAAGAMTAVTFVCFTETVLMNTFDFQWMLVVLIGAKMALNEPDPEDTQGRTSVFEQPDAWDNDEAWGYEIGRG